MSALIVNQTITHYLSNSINVNLLMLYASKSFDKIDLIKLFEKLVKSGLCLIIIRIILNMYVCQKCQIKWNNVISNICEVINGVRQDSYVSNIVWNLYCLTVIIGKT
ncbi:unnamed protein product [Meganyctiphanes norvegica]|uniref:Reverse transcriptase domain-containing protein n=1 Tax=Meganyctiphanes norvegica TaxID=48144 RepID=A0AAV2RRS2_MEGNR